MSGQQTLIKIAVSCAAIVLGSIVVGSQLSTGGVTSLVPKAAEEDKAGVVESDDGDEANARDEQDEDVAEADDEGAADEEAAEEEMADESEIDEGSDGDEVASEDAGSEDDSGQQQAAAPPAEDGGDVIYNGLPVEPGTD